MQKHFYSLLFLFFFSLQAIGQNYRTAADGNWQDAAIWQIEQTGSWVAASSPPEAGTAGPINIAHAVAITTSVSADELSIAAGGSLQIESGAQLTIKNGAGTDLQVNGNLLVYGSLQLNDGGEISSSTDNTTFYDQARYYHNYSASGGSIPLASWEDGSAVHIIGLTTTSFDKIQNLGQSFYDVVWNTPDFFPDDGVNRYDLRNGLQAIRGSLRIVATGSNAADTEFSNLVLGNGSATLSIGHALEVGGKVYLSSGISIGGDLLITDELNADKYEISLAGNWENNGSFIAGTGQVIFDGTTKQTIGGSAVTTFEDLELSNSAAVVQLASDQQLNGVLTVNGGATFDPDGADGSLNFTLLSTSPEHAAAVASLATGGIIDGEVVVQRYLPVGRTWRYIGSPSTNAHMEQWADDFTISGPYAGGSGTASVMKYDETKDGGLNDGWTGTPESGQTLAATSVPNGKGFAAFMYSQGSNLVEVRGRLNAGGATISLPLTYTSTGILKNDGWNLVANPFASAIDLEAAGWMQEGVSNTISIPNNYDGSGNLQFATYNRATGQGTLGGNRYIASGQAFWVKAEASTPKITLAQSVKAPYQNAAKYFRTTTHTDYLRLSMLDSASQLRDETIIGFYPDGSSNYDRGLDGMKMHNGTLNISSFTADNQEVVYNYFNWEEVCERELIIKLNTTNLEVGKTYTLAESELNSFNRPYKIRLIDNFLNTSTQLQEGFSYRFTITEDSASFGPDRFKLGIMQPSVLDNLQLSYADEVCEGYPAEIEIINAEVGVQFQLVNLTGDIVRSKQIGSGKTLLLNIPEEQLVDGENQLILQAQRENCNTSLVQDTLFIYKSPVYEVTSTEATKVCKYGSVKITVAGAPAAGLYYWYDSKTATEPLAITETDSWYTPFIYNSTYYYVSIVNQLKCESNTRVKVLAEVDPGPEATLGQRLYYLCPGDSVTITASGAPEKGSYRWYSATNQLLAETIKGIFTTSAISGSTVYQVKAVSAEGCEGKGSLSTIMVKSAFCTEGAEEVRLGQESIETNLEYRLYPNPVRQEELSLELQGLSGEPVSLEVISMEGKVQEVAYNENQISAHQRHFKLNVSNLKSGMYVIRLIAGGKATFIRFVKE